MEDEMENLELIGLWDVDSGFVSAVERFLVTVCSCMNLV